MSEKDWITGHRAAWQSILSQALRELGDAAPKAARLVAEREAAIATLRQVCEEFGDNDWEPNLHLSDIIDKHLACYLEAPPNEGGEP